MRQGLLFGALMLGGAGVVATSQPQADVTRRSRAEDKALVFAPNGPMLKAASLDQHEPVADMLWMRSVLIFGERWKVDPDPTWIAWLRGTVLAVTDLDPTWRSPYFYGGSLLRVLGDIDGSDAVFKRGAEALPDDGYFAFNYAMNMYLYHADPTGAAAWMERASTGKSAATWYASAAAALRRDGGDLEGAIRYLEEQRKAEKTDAERADTDYQLGRLYHDRLAKQFLPACEAYAAANHAPPPSAEAFFHWAGTATPTNPRGDAWIVGADGCIRSEAAEHERVRRLLKAERPYLQ